MLKVLLVFVGSGLGGACRYGYGIWAQKLAPMPFPHGTIAINALGSFLIALVLGLSVRGDWVGPELRLFLTTGIMGGFTTYSTFNAETLLLAQQGNTAAAALNVLVTVVGCLVTGALGLGLARVIVAA